MGGRRRSGGSFGNNENPRLSGCQIDCADGIFKVSWTSALNFDGGLVPALIPPLMDGGGGTAHGRSISQCIIDQVPEVSNSPRILQILGEFSSCRCSYLKSQLQRFRPLLAPSLPVTPSQLCPLPPANGSHLFVWTSHNPPCARHLSFKVGLPPPHPLTHNASPSLPPLPPLPVASTAAAVCSCRLSPWFIRN